MSQPTRDEIRAALFGIKQRSKIVAVAGTSIEVRQPRVADILNADTTDDRKATITRMMCDYCFVPGTEIKVFDIEDADGLMGIPFGKDWQALNGAINELSDLGEALALEKGNSEATPGA